MNIEQIAQIAFNAMQKKRAAESPRSHFLMWEEISAEAHNSHLEFATEVVAEATKQANTIRDEQEYLRKLEARITKLEKHMEGKP